MKTLVVALHQAFPAVRLSDYVIMPDHAHFLMICDYETNQAINPLRAMPRGSGISRIRTTAR